MLKTPGAEHCQNACGERTKKYIYIAVTWQTVHEHIVADAFCSKKSSSALLVHEQQAPQN